MDRRRVDAPGMSWNGTKHGTLSHQCVVHHALSMSEQSDSLCRLSAIGVDWLRKLKTT